MPEPAAESAVPTGGLLAGLCDELRGLHPRGRILVGIDGEDGAGKTVFADGLATVLADEGMTVFRASIDGFHRPKAERYARGRTSPEGFYRDSYDLDAFCRDLIERYRAGGSFRTAVHDIVTDGPVERVGGPAPSDAVLVVDGIFLHRPELRELWHWSVWLEAPMNVRYARMAVRDGSDPDPFAESNRRYRVGQELYRREAEPRSAACVIVDNTDPAHPRRSSVDIC